MYRPKNVEKQEERGSGSVEIKLGRHSVIEFGFPKSVGDNLMAMGYRIVARLCDQIQRLSYPPQLKKKSAITTVGCIRS